jgi:hypothetical protein
MRIVLLLVVFAFLFSVSTASAQDSAHGGAHEYQEAIERISQKRKALAKQWSRAPSKPLQRAIEGELVDAVGQLTQHWLGTRWALGSPQTTLPQIGKVNCGTFVGRVLHDVGFNVEVRKLQRQPSQLIIKSFVGKDRMRKFSNKPMKTFLASVREMGPGLFIIGLDFHVGFLLQTSDDLRFVHASFETETVVNEDAATAMPITTSNYKVVGKILSPGNIASWLKGSKIQVRGDW